MPDAILLSWQEVASRISRSLYARNGWPADTPFTITPAVEGLLVEIAPEPQPTPPTPKVMPPLVSSRA